jgi:hypothetical protein
MRRWELVGAALGASLCASVIAAACGARSDLLLGEERAPAGAAGSGGGAPDGGVDGDGDGQVPVDAPADVPFDVPFDVPMDAPEDVVEDAPPPECSDPTILYIYVVTDAAALYAYKPTSNAFEPRGVLNCPAQAGATPFSMAVDRAGIARVLYNSGELFEVKTANAKCKATGFMPGQQGFVLFGMGYEWDQDGLGETLYVAEINFMGPSKGLGRLDTGTYTLSFIGTFSQNPGPAIELTPTGEGRLHGYFLNSGQNGGTLVEIDTQNAAILSATSLAVGQQSSSLAIGWWGGSFYIFTQPQGGGGSLVTRYTPSNGSVVQINSIAEAIVGAGVSTCAPAG